MFVIISALSFSLIPIFALFAYESNVNTTTLLFLRFGIASFAFFTYLVLAGKQWRITKGQLLQLILLGGILHMLHSTFYFSSVKYIPASLATMIFYLYPIFVAILSFFFNKEALSKKLIIAIALSLIGIILVLGTPTGSISPIGIYLACGAAVVYSFYILLGDKVTKQLPPLITTTYISLFSFISFLISGIFTKTIHLQINSTGWVIVAFTYIFLQHYCCVNPFRGNEHPGSYEIIDIKYDRAYKHHFIINTSVC